MRGSCVERDRDAQSLGHLLLRGTVLLGSVRGVVTQPTHCCDADGDPDQLAPLRRRDAHSCCRRRSTHGTRAPPTRESKRSLCRRSSPCFTFSTLRTLTNDTQSRCLCLATRLLIHADATKSLAPASQAARYASDGQSGSSSGDGVARLRSCSAVSGDTVRKCRPNAKSCSPGTSTAL